MSFGVTKRASSCRSRFSSRIFSEYGSRDTPGNACSSLLRLKISTGSLARVHSVLVSKEFVLLIALILSNRRDGEACGEGSRGSRRVLGVEESWESKSPGSRRVLESKSLGRRESLGRVGMIAEPMAWLAPLSWHAS